MGLVYLPTNLPNQNQLNVAEYISPMSPMGKAIHMGRL